MDRSTELLHLKGPHVLPVIICQSPFIDTNPPLFCRFSLSTSQKPPRRGSSCHSPYSSETPVGFPVRMVALKDQLSPSCKESFIGHPVKVSESQRVSETLWFMGLSVEDELRYPKSGYALDVSRHVSKHKDQNRDPDRLDSGVRRDLLFS